MKELIQYIKEHLRSKIIVIIIVVIVIIGMIVGVPILIQVCFDVPAPFKWLEAKWKPEDLLGYYGDVLGFIGTVVLSSLALWQNHVIKIESDKREKLLEQMEYSKHLPILHCSNSFCDGNYRNLVINILNASDNVADELEIDNFQVKDLKGNIVCESTNVTIKRKILFGRTDIEVEFINPDMRGNDLKMEFVINYKDKFGKLHKCRVHSDIENAAQFSNTYEIVEEK